MKITNLMKAKRYHDYDYEYEFYVDDEIFVGLLKITHASKGSPGSWDEPPEPPEIEYELVWVHPDVEKEVLSHMDANAEEIENYLFDQLIEAEADQKAEAAYDRYVDRQMGL